MSRQVSYCGACGCECHNDDKLLAAKEIARLKEDYANACETIAKMHEAAVGEVTGPKKGVVEDVLEVKLSNQKLREALAAGEPILLEAADRIEELEASNRQWAKMAGQAQAQVEALADKIKELEDSLIYANLKPCPQCAMAEAKVVELEAENAELKEVKDIIQERYDMLKGKYERRRSNMCAAMQDDLDEAIRTTAERCAEIAEKLGDCILNDEPRVYCGDPIAAEIRKEYNL